MEILNNLEIVEELNKVKNLSKKDLLEKLFLLEKIGCTNRQIISIIKCNPIYLERCIEDIFNLIKILLKLGFRSLNILFDANPFILNLDSFQIKDYIDEKLKSEKLEDIVDELDSNPYLFQEI